MDQLRLDILTQLLIRRVRHRDKSEQVYHLRFPKPRIDAYIQRPGNAPAPNAVRKDAHAQEISGYIPGEWRFPWEKGLRLELDLGPIPDVIARAVTDLMNLYKDPDLSDDAMRQVRNLLIMVIAKHTRKIMGAEFRGQPLTAQELSDMHDAERFELLKKVKYKTKQAASRITVLPRLPGLIHHDRIKYRG